MIAISAVLVLVAILLLIAGLVAQGLTLLYAAIAVCLVAAGFLLAGTYRPRPLLDPADDPGPPPDRFGRFVGRWIGHRRRAGSQVVLPPEIVGPPAPLPAPPVQSTGNDSQPARSALTPPRPQPPTGGIVFVVDGRPRYHVQSCPRLTGAGSEPLEVEEAREIGFLPCPVCHPDREPAAAADATGGFDELDDAAFDDADTALPTGEYADEEGDPAADVTEPRPAVAVTDRSAHRPMASSPASSAGSGPTGPAGPGGGPARPARRPTALSGRAPRAAPPVRNTVQVVPGRARYHLAECRYVKGVPGVVAMAKDEAREAGYTPCRACGS